MKKGTWLTCREDIKVLDCTVRDGGLMNNHFFEDSFVKSIYEANVKAGIDYMELGYKGAIEQYPEADHGPWKRCAEEDMRRIVGDNPTDLKLCVMADADRCNYKRDILPADESVLDLIRIATYIHQIPTAIEMIQDAHEKGYETSINLMAISVVHDKELEEALKVLATTDVDTIYIVDSFGSYYPEQMNELTKKYIDIAKSTGKQVGLHAHNNQQLAYANTVEALIQGVNFLDATMDGMGRGAGNCPVELLLGFLKNPKFHLRPVLECIHKTVRPLRKDLKWGYDIPYMLTGQLNQHPRAAIKYMENEADGAYEAFYDALIEEQS